jgi:hypothetical protein
MPGQSTQGAPPPVFPLCGRPGRGRLLPLAALLGAARAALDLAFFCRLCFWAAFCLPVGLVLRALWQARTPTLPRRLRHLLWLRALQVPRTRCPVPQRVRSSSPGRGTVGTSNDYDDASDVVTPDPYLAALFLDLHQPIPRSSLPHPGDCYSASCAGLRGSFQMPSRASDESPAGGPEKRRGK